MKKGLFLFFAILIATIAHSQDFITHWDLSYPGSTPNSITFGVGTIGPVNYIWETVPAGTTGSGSFNGSSATITGLPTNAVIKLKINPTNFNQFKIGWYGIDRQRLIDVEQWGTTQWSSMDSAFYTCNHLNISSLDIPNLSIVTSMVNMFGYCSVLNGPTNIDNWNTSNIINMDSLFFGANIFNQPIGNWDVSNVTSMNSMFVAANTFNQPIGNWDVSNVTNMYCLFGAANTFNQPIGNWDVSSVIDMKGMFNGAMAFNQPIGNWDVSNVTNMSRMFHFAISFNQPIGNWDVSNVTNMSEMFNSDIVFNQPIGNWNVSSVTTMYSMFNQAYNFNQPIGNWDVSSVTHMSWMFLNDTTFNQQLTDWDVSNVIYMGHMFGNAKSFNQPIGNWNTGNLVQMVGLFSHATSFNQPIGNWNTSNVANMGGVFAYATSFNQPLGNWNTSNATIMTAMFDSAISFNQSIGNWNLSSINQFNSGMFNMLDNCGMDCSNYSSTLTGWANNINTPNSVIFSAANLHYNNATQTNRNYLIINKGWTITGDNLNIGYCCATQYTNINQTVCNAYFFNNQTLTSSGTYYDTLLNSVGCDSIITLYLTIHNTTNYTYNYSSCSSYFFNNQLLTTSGTYKDTLLNAFGCDSIITLNLIILPNIPVYQTLNITTCNSYYFNNQLLTSNGIYHDTLISQTGCDSIVTLNLNIINSNNAVSQNGTLLTALASGSTYQWLTCNPFSPISLATNQTYNAVFNGSYAVAQTHPNGCTDTSSCITVTSVGINELNTNNSKRIIIYPNPATNQLFIESKEAKNFTIYSSIGEAIYQTSQKEKSSQIDISNFSKGIYFIRINNETMSFIKQ